MAIDFEAIFGVEEYDPCTALVALRPAYYRLIAGEGSQKISFRDRDLWLYRGDKDAMRAVITQLETECAAKNGTTARRRFAITAGSRQT